MKRWLVLAILISIIIAAGGTVTLSVAGGCGDSSHYALAGYKWSAFPVTYSIGSTVPAEFAPSIRAGFATWDREEHPKGQMFTEVPTGSAQIDVSFGTINDKLASTQSTYTVAGGVLVHASIIFEKTEAWTVYPSELCVSQGTGVDVQSIATHEIGHAVGLDHYSDPPLTMYPNYTPGSTYQRSLATGDKLGLAAIYP